MSRVNTKPAINFPSNRAHYSGLGHSEREILGYKCKRILDMGRVRYLEANGFQSYLIYYVDSLVSLENVALLAIRK